jgi:hypothetical protein
MAYTKGIVCFANSDKTGGSCIAGKDVKDGAWIRPVSDRPTEELSFSEYCYEGYKSPQLLDIIDVPLLRAVPHDHQTENHLINREPWVRRGALPWADLERFRDRPESLWANVDSTKGGGIYDCMSPQIAARSDYSLALIRRKKLTVEVGTRTWDGATKKTYRGRFKYKDITYGFRITDPVARAAFKNKDVGEYELKRCVPLPQPDGTVQGRRPVSQADCSRLH